MRIGILSLFLVPLLSPAAEIPQGSHVALRMVNSITTKTAKEGDFVYMTTATPIAAADRIVVPVGSYVQGVVTKTIRPGKVKGTAELTIRLDNLTLTDGRVVRIAPKLAAVDADGSSQKVDSTEGEIKQGPSHGQDVRTVSALGITGAGLGAIADRSAKGAGIGAGAGGVIGLVTVLATRGREVELRSGATVDAVFDHPVPID